MSVDRQERAGRDGRDLDRAQTGTWLGRSLVAGCGGLALLAVLPPSVVAAELEELFAFFDANGDGVIDPQEFQLRKTEVFFRNIKDMDANMTLGPADTNLTPEAFAEADLNGDGQLSGAEFVQARFARFELYDADSDQRITFAEFESFITPFVRD